MVFDFKKSTRKNKKYMVKIGDGDKWIHFGDTRYHHFNDKALGLYSHLNHYDMNRLENYRKRAMGIKNKKGELTYKDINSPNYWSLRYLW